MATLTDQIRDAISSSGGMSATQLMEVLPEGTKKDTVWALLTQRKKAGEFGSRVEDGMAVYFIANPDAPKPPAPAPAEQAEAQPPAASRQPPAASRQPPAASRQPPAASEKPAAPRAKVKPPATPARRDLKAASDSQAKVRAALEFNHATACDAVEVYIASVADLGIYHALCDARDRSRVALDEYLVNGGRDG